MGFKKYEVDQVLLVDEPEIVEPGPLTSSADTGAVARLGDVFKFGWHRVA